MFDGGQDCCRGWRRFPQGEACRTTGLNRGTHAQKASDDPLFQTYRATN